MGEGDIGAVIESFNYDAVYAHAPEILKVYDTIYAVAYTCANGDGFLFTIDISNAGDIAGAVIDTIEFEGTDCHNLAFIHVTGNVYFLVYQRTAGRGFMGTISIDNAGNIGGTWLDFLDLGALLVGGPSLVQVAPTIFAFAYQGAIDDGFVSTIEVLSGGQVGASLIDTFEFGPSNGLNCKIVHVSGNVFAIAYRGNGLAGRLCYRYP